MRHAVFNVASVELNGTKSFLRATTLVCPVYNAAKRGGFSPCVVRVPSVRG